MEFKTILIPLSIFVYFLSTGAQSAFTQTTTDYRHNNGGLSQFPNITDRKTLTLVTVYGNQISDIPSELLTGFDALTQLFIWANQFSEFPDLSLIGGTLGTLQLQQNQLSFIPAGRLDNLDVIVHLNLENNQFSIFPNVTGVGNSLRDLILHKNDITVVPVDVIEHMHALRNLQMNYNPLASFPDVTSIANTITQLGVCCGDIPSVENYKIEPLHLLQSLTLWGNPVTNFPNVTAAGNTLTAMHLAHNEIAFVPADILNSMVTIRNLYFSDNLLSAIPDIAYPHAQLGMLHLDNNQLNEFISFNLAADATDLKLHGNQLTNITSGHWLLGKDDANTKVTLYDNPLVSIQAPDTFSNRKFEFDSTQLTTLPPCQVSNLVHANQHDMILCNGECSATDLIQDAVVACSQSMGLPNKDYPGTLYIQKDTELPLTGEIVPARGLMDCGRMCSERYWCLGFYFSHSHKCALKFENIGMNSALPENEQWSFNEK